MHSCVTERRGNSEFLDRRKETQVQRCLQHSEGSQARLSLGPLWHREEGPRLLSLCFSLSLLQVTGEAAGRRGDTGVERRRAASDHAHAGPACGGLHLLWPPSPLHHRHHERSGFLHQLWHSLQPGRGHRVHGQQQHDPPWGPRGGAGSCFGELCSLPVVQAHSFPVTTP